MDINEYFDALDKKIGEMSDEEFMKLLEESGLEKCPYCEMDMLAEYNQRIMKKNGFAQEEVNKIVNETLRR